MIIPVTRMNLRLLLCSLPILGFLCGGCSSPKTQIDFDSPTNSVLQLGKSSYVFPGTATFEQRTKDPMHNEEGYNVNIDIADAASPGGRLPVTGKLYVFRSSLSDVDRMARNMFSIPPEKIQALKQGAAVTIEGMSADGGKLLYRAILGLRKNDKTHKTP
jgi:hypothetical protein